MDIDRRLQQRFAIGEMGSNDQLRCKSFSRQAKLSGATLEGAVC
jgi:hypothetical protein